VNKSLILVVKQRPAALNKSVFSDPFTVTAAVSTLVFRGSHQDHSDEPLGDPRFQFCRQIPPDSWLSKHWLSLRIPDRSHLSLGIHQFVDSKSARMAGLAQKFDKVVLCVLPLVQR
jgi:hypothetical protein